MLRSHESFLKITGLMLKKGFGNLKAVFAFGCICAQHVIWHHQHLICV